MKHTIAIVDDHILIANALSGIISNFDDFKVLFVCEGGKDLQEKLKVKSTPEIVLLDVNMPVMDGFETAKWLKETYPDILILALSMKADDCSLIRMIRNGAKGYILKNIYPKELLNALTKILKNGYYFPDWAARKVYASIGEDTIDANLKSGLSEREAEFLKYTATEMTYKEISEKMCCSPRTIDNYRDSLFDKLNIKTRVGLAVYAIKKGYSE
ncbi:LuxR family two component transcriptional regulator [Aquimarina sp. MAR_2010_214]|uniref:response regulator transcription factor n=1 Tax=Aquimarina sp. MAR_2010_214 TaxID=1250026 RepID=UPI000C712200|nr:response regulator transcription factor [Aquimarina sp. MAR_2010_214]PKV50791.1 LuxR family two component transcriptional regulator [Aquimarina sp. MAR_2010_214]